MEDVMEGRKFMRGPIINHGMGPLINHVAEYQNGSSSLGYTYLYYIDVLYPSSEVKLLAVDGVYPDEQSITNGSYPLTVSYYGVIREEDREATGGLFLDWMRSDEGQRCIAQTGYIPISF